MHWFLRFGSVRINHRQSKDWAFNILRNFVLYILEKNGNVYATIDFLNFSRGKQDRKSPLNVLLKRNQHAMVILMPAVKNNAKFSVGLILNRSLNVRQFHRHCRSCLKYVNTKC